MPIPPPPPPKKKKNPRKRFVPYQDHAFVQFQSRLDSTTPRGVDSMIYGGKGQAVRDSGQSYPSSAPSYHSASSTSKPHPEMGAAPPGPSAANRVLGQQPYATLADITNKGKKTTTKTSSKLRIGTWRGVLCHNKRKSIKKI